MDTQVVVLVVHGRSDSAVVGESVAVVLSKRCTAVWRWIGEADRSVWGLGIQHGSGSYRLLVRALMPIKLQIDYIGRSQGHESPRFAHKRMLVHARGR